MVVLLLIVKTKKNIFLTQLYNGNKFVCLLFDSKDSIEIFIHSRLVANISIYSYSILFKLLHYFIHI